MATIDDRLRKVCNAHDLRAQCLERLLECEENKKQLIRKRGLKQDFMRILEQEVQRQEEAR